MSDDRAFLDRILTTPADSTPRLVYADWLDEAGTPGEAARAEFLRLQAELPRARKGRGRAIRSRLRELAASLEPDWLAVVSELAIENCGAGGTAVDRFSLRTIEFDYQCPRQWEQLRATDNDGIRYCEACHQDVYYCDTIMSAREHVEEGHCVAVDIGLPRKPRDLEPPRRMVGFISPEYFREEDERRKPDPVSEARQRRKRGSEE